MSNHPVALDLTGQPFRVRQRGGKYTRRQKERESLVDQGSFVPRQWWDPETRKRKLSEGERRSELEWVGLGPVASSSSSGPRPAFPPRT